MFHHHDHQIKIHIVTDLQAKFFCLLSNTFSVIMQNMKLLSYEQQHTFSVIMQNMKLLSYEQQHDSTTPQHVPKTESIFTSSKVCIVDKDLQRHQASLGYNELHMEARTKLLPFFTHIFKTFFFSNLTEFCFYGFTWKWISFIQLMVWHWTVHKPLPEPRFRMPYGIMPQFVFHWLHLSQVSSQKTSIHRQLSYIPVTLSKK